MAAPGVERVVVTGDSFPMGQGVAESEAYPEVLGELLRQRRYRVEVLNLGIAGIPIAGAVNRAERIGLTFSPRVLVYGFTINDIEGPRNRRTRDTTEGKALMARKVALARSPSHLVRVLGPEIDALRDFVSPRCGSYAHELQDNCFRNPEAWSDFVFQLERFRRLCDTARAGCILLIHTGLVHLPSALTRIDPPLLARSDPPGELT